MAHTKIQTIVDDITEQIRTGRLAPGEKLPSAAEMRAQYGVSQQPVRTAIERLRAGGWVVTAPGAGIFVADQPPTG